jgi:hypothetical protein
VIGSGPGTHRSAVVPCAHDSATPSPACPACSTRRGPAPYGSSRGRTAARSPPVSAITESGEAFLTPTVYGGVPPLRAAFSNWRTTGADAELTGGLERAERLQRDGLRMAEELGLWTEAARLSPSRVMPIGLDGPAVPGPGASAHRERGGRRSGSPPPRPAAVTGSHGGGHRVRPRAGSQLQPLVEPQPSQT